MELELELMSYKVQQLKSMILSELREVERERLEEAGRALYRALAEALQRLGVQARFAHAAALLADLLCRFGVDAITACREETGRDARECYAEAVDVVVTIAIMALETLATLARRELKEPPRGVM